LPAPIGNWLPNSAQTAGRYYDYNFELYRRKTNGTTGATFNAAEYDKVNPTLSSVALSGSYNDLSNKPTIPSAYSLPTATSSVLGGVSIGSGVSIDGNGAISVSTAYAASSHTHTASSITDFASAVASASPAEVLEYTTSASFPATGSTGKIYVATDASRAYRWTGAAYAEVGPSGPYYGYASTAQSQDLTATTVVMNPANVRTAIRSFVRSPYGTNYTASGGTVNSLNNTVTCNLTGGASANGAAVTYHQGNGWSGRFRQGFDWSLPTAFNISITRQTCPSTGIFRALFGCLTSAYGWGTLDGRGIGFEIRQSRIWVLAHNGTSLTSVDSGIDTFSGDYQQEVVDIWIRSDGSGSVTLTRSLNGGTASSYTTTGGPSATTTGTNACAWVGVNNGATASSANFIFSPQLVSVQ
jgi:hypothetical protein